MSIYAWIRDIDVLNWYLYFMTFTLGISVNQGVAWNQQRRFAMKALRELGFGTSRLVIYSRWSSEFEAQVRWPPQLSKVRVPSRMHMCDHGFINLSRKSTFGAKKRAENGKLFFSYFCMKRQVMIVPMTYVMSSEQKKNVLKTKKLYFLFFHEMKSYDGLCWSLKDRSFLKRACSSLFNYYFNIFIHRCKMWSDKSHSRTVYHWPTFNQHLFFL